MDFPKGAAFADWLVQVGASGVRGAIDVTEVKNSVTDSNRAVWRRWIHAPSTTAAKHMSFNTPIGAPAEKQCGRGVFSDLASCIGDDSKAPVPPAPIPK